MVLILIGARKQKETCMIWLLKVFSFSANGLDVFGNSAHGNFHAPVKMQFLWNHMRVQRHFLTMKRFDVSLSYINFSSYKP